MAIKCYFKILGTLLLQAFNCFR